MDATENARRATERYATAWAGEDLAGALNCYADDFTLHYFGNNPFTGDHVGKDVAIGVLLEVTTRAPRHLIAVDEILAGPNASVIVARETIECDGHATEVRRVLRFRVAGDHLAECWLYEEDQALIDRAWSTN